MVAGSLEIEVLARRSCHEVMTHLSRDPLRNLLLLDLVASLDRPSAPGEVPTQVLLGRDAGGICGVVAVRPSLVLDAALSPSSLAAFMPYLEGVEAGLVKSPSLLAAALWDALAARGRRAVIDRLETGLVLRSGSRFRVPPLPSGALVRRAAEKDLEDLVVAARASLRDEGRPDPSRGDPAGFWRWVRGRISRARVVEVGGRVVFVGYADVRRREGWLVQGVYTWPDERRRGWAEIGMAGLIREAFAEGANHVQLAVVAGNSAAEHLYRGIGFRPFSQLRTILFA